MGGSSSELELVEVVVVGIVDEIELEVVGNSFEGFVGNSLEVIVGSSSQVEVVACSFAVLEA